MKSTRKCNNNSLTFFYSSFHSKKSVQLLIIIYSCFMSKKNKKGVKIIKKSKTKLAKKKKKHHHKHHRKDKEMLSVDTSDIETEVSPSESMCLGCKNSNHLSINCPNIWRVYKLQEKNTYIDKSILPIHKMYCYNCASKGHLGDDCTIRPFLEKDKDGFSAFSGKNLHEKLQNIYYSMLKKQDEHKEDIDHTSGISDTINDKPDLRSFHFFRPPYQQKR